MSAPAPPCVRYREIGPLAEGGMAALTAALDEAGGPVVIKRVRPHLCFDAAYQQLFADEGALAARLDHPNIVRLLDSGEDECGPYLVFERVEGTDLGVVLEAAFERERPLELAAALAVFIPLMRGLHAAHEAVADDGQALGLVHRDVSPGNVLLSTDGDVKLADFGVAKSALKTDETVAGEMKGKFAYMAPEQSRGDVVDRRTDLFAAGIVLYECLTGRRLFDGPTDADVVHAVRTAEPQDPTAHNAELPDELAQLLGRLLAKEPDQRPATAAEVADALYEVACDLCLESGLRRHVAHLARTHPRPGLEEESAPGAAVRRRTQRVIQPDTAPRRSSERGGRSRAPLWMLGTALLLGGGGLAWRLGEPAQPTLVVERIPDLEPPRPQDDSVEPLEDGAEPAADEVTAPRELPALVVRPPRSAEPQAERATEGAPPRRAQKARGPRVVRALDRRRPVEDQATGGASEEKAEQRGFGRLYLNSKPWATVLVDGAELGDTPIMGVRLAAGSHRITLVNPHYKIEESFRITVPKGGKVRRMVELGKP